MKCFLKSNLVFLALFLLICFVDGIILNSNPTSKNSISKPENINIIKKLTESEFKLSKEGKETLERSFKNFYVLKNQNPLLDNKKFFIASSDSNFPIILSFIALCLGFIFAGIFTVFAFLFSK